jgi:hypothetical protein
MEWTIIYNDLLQLNNFGDERRMKVVEMGGAKELLNVLKADTDDKTCKEILNALVALSKSGAPYAFMC